MKKIIYRVKATGKISHDGNYCSKCSFSLKRRLCDNQKKQTRGGALNDDICLEGMRKYAERGEKQ